MSDFPESQPQPQRQRLRITFGKLGSQKYIGHLDLAKTWERILRRAEIGLTYSQGFNARPKIQLGAALPLGITSEAELMDIWLEQPVPLEGLAERLMAVSPPGLPIYRIEEALVKSPALPTLLASSDYRFTLRDPVDPNDLRQCADSLMAQPQIMRTRRDKPYDLRPLLIGIEVTLEGELMVEMVQREQAAGRPDELIDALGLNSADVAVHRLRIKMREP
jgi:radical SAM-linked protein